MAAPALEHDTQNLLLGDVWKRFGLAPCDRSAVCTSGVKRTAIMSFSTSRYYMDKQAKP